MIMNCGGLISLYLVMFFALGATARPNNLPARGDQRQGTLVVLKSNSESAQSRPKRRPLLELCKYSILTFSVV